MQNFRISAVIFALITASSLLTGCGGSAAAGSPSGGSAPTPAPSPVTSPSPVPSPSPSPTPPAPNTTVIDNAQNSPNWLTCGACGNTGGTGAVAGATFTPGINAPSEDLIATQFNIAPPSAFANAYFYRQQTPVTSQINALTYEFDLYIPSGMETAPQAVEFECQQVIGGWVYNFSWQAPYHGAATWRIFDYGLKRWDATSVPVQPFSPGTWHHIVADYHNDTANHLVIHDALTVDGVRFPVNITHNAAFTGGRDQFTNAVQLDSNSSSTPYTIYVDKMKITYQQ